jgi:hypothetical protein
MGLTMPFACPVDGCAYITHFRLGMGEELDSSAHAERLEVLRREHPNHPAADTGSTPPISVGDRFTLAAGDVGDCPGEFVGAGGMLAFCVLDHGHAGPHVATDGSVVVEVWS